MTKAVIVSAARTAVGTFGGALKDIPASNLGAIAVTEAIQRAGIKPEMVDDVILGNILQAGQGQNCARQAAIKAGLPVEVPAVTVNILCGSGLRSVLMAAQAIKAGEADIVVAGGMESMSQAPYLLPAERWGARMGHGQVVDHMIFDALTCAFNKYHMGVTAENVAARYGLSREEQDAFALASQQKAVAAMNSGYFKEEIVPVPVPQRKGDPILFDTDEHPKASTTAESLAKLKPAFQKDGTVTAGNASGINDGAAALVIMSETKAKELGLTPLATIVAGATAGVDPAVMGIGPIDATRKALGRAGWTVDDLELIEANEAFAAQALAVGKTLGFKDEILNVSGGAIAMGHPVGASGARILVTLLYGMKRLGKKKGLATLCVGGGMGVSCLIEMN